MPVIRGTAKWFEPRPSGTLYVQYASFIKDGDIGTAVSDITHDCLLQFRREFGRSPIFYRSVFEIKFNNDQINAVLFEYPDTFSLDPESDS